MNADDGFLLELALIAVLILLNGFFASAEMAIVSARRPRLQALLEAGRRPAGAVLRLKADPDRFLATVQIGVTVVGTLASAVGGVAAIERLEPVFSAIDVPWVRNVAEPLSVGVVVSVIAYLSLVVGELVPKALAVRNAESLAMLTARTVEALSRVVRPLVSVLTASSRLLLRAMRQGDAHVPPFHTLEDLRAMAEEAAQQGVVPGGVIKGAVEFHERQVREVVTPRRRIKALPVGSSLKDALRLIGDTGHSRFPVYGQGVDDVLGFVYARDVYETALRGHALDLAGLVRPLMAVPGSKPATALLSEMQKGRMQMALVIDEHGGIEGLITIEDLVEVIVGEIHDEHETPSEPLRALGEGAWEADGGTPVHEINADARLRLPESSDYVTIGGLVLERLGTIPRGGETVDVPPCRLTVLAVDGHRVARVRIEVVAASD